MGRMSTSNPYRPVVELFGGPSKLARDVDEPAPKVSKWPIRGIPGKYWGKVARAAKTRAEIERLQGNQKRAGQFEAVTVEHLSALAEVAAQHA